MDKKPVKLEQSQIAAIERTLARGDRVEITPTKDGFRVCRVSRTEIIKQNKDTPS